MKLNYIKYQTISMFLLSCCFSISLIVVPKVNGGFHIQFHPGLAMYALLSVIFVVEAIKRTKFRPNGIETFPVFIGLTVGTIGIMNIIMINPWHGQGLMIPWIITFGIVFYFRSFFFPFHLTGFEFVKNIAICAGILYIIKLIIMWGLFPSILSIDDSFKNYYDLCIMSFLWLIGILLYGGGVFITSQTIRNENENTLRSIKSQIGLTNNDMMLLGISNHDLMGKSSEEIEDIINNRARKLLESYSKCCELEEFIRRNNHGEKKWIPSVSGLLEHKQNSITQSLES